MKSMEKTNLDIFLEEQLKDPDFAERRYRSIRRAKRSR